MARWKKLPNPKPNTTMSKFKETSALLLKHLRAGWETRFVIKAGRGDTVRAYFGGDPTSFSAIGGGYDKYGTVLGDILQYAFQAELLDYYKKNPGSFDSYQEQDSFQTGNGHMTGVTAVVGERFLIEGARGVGRMLAIAKTLGATVDRIDMGGQDVFTIKRSEAFAEDFNCITVKL